MLRTRAILALGVLCLLAAPASAQYTNIDDIQVYSATGVPQSPSNGLVVTIRGVLTCENGTYNTGTHYVQDATGGLQVFQPGAPALTLGDEVEVTGTVSNFSGEIQIGSDAVFTFKNVSTPPAPIELGVQQALDFDLSGTQTAEDYELVGMLVAVTGNIAYLPGFEPPPFVTGTGQGTIGLTDASGDTLTVFIDRTTGIDPAGLGNGELYKIISPMVSYNGLLELKPRFQDDLIENPADPYPVISDILPQPWTPELNDAVQMQASITDNSAIASAYLHYRYVGDVSFTQVAMVDGGGGIYSTTIPGTTASGIEYYLEATDDAAQVTTVPGDAPASSRYLAVGTTTIQEIQSTMAEGSDASAFVGQIVNIEALVTMAPGEFQASGYSNYAVGEAEGGAWSAIFVYEGSGSNIFLRGDRVRISGQIGEYSGMTEILPQDGTAVELVGFGEPAPPITTLPTQALDLTEAYESVIVGVVRATVTDTLLAGVEWLLKDASSDSTVYVDPAPGVGFTATPGEEMYLTGFLDTRFGRNEVVPRSDDDIILPGSVGTDPTPTVREARVTQIYPNPFNPSTKIEFEIPRTGLTELAIYNARGERVRTLVNGELLGGSHFREWNGMDDRGKKVSSGVYFARLRFMAESLSVYKLTLVK